MKKKIAGIHLYDFAIVLVLALIAILLGTFRDLQISTSLAHVGNIFGKIFAVVGKYPGYLIFGSAGILFYVYKKDDEEKGSKAWAYAFLIAIPLAVGALYGYDDLTELISNKIAAIFVGALAIGAGEVGMYFLFRHANKEAAYNAGMTFLFSAVLVFVTTYLLKNAALRPRYSWLVSVNHLDYYQTWYAFNSSIKEANSTVDSSNFMSWPSSHVAMASIAVLAALFPKLNKKLEGKEGLCFLAAALWTLIVAIARVSDGSHFLSDVGWGALIGTGFSLLVASLVYPTEVTKAKEPVTEEVPMQETFTSAPMATKPAEPLMTKPVEPTPKRESPTTIVTPSISQEPAKPAPMKPEEPKAKEKKKKKDDFYEIDS